MRLASLPMPAQGWCPSTYRIHESPDGGLARIRVPGGALTLDQLRVVAETADRMGNGRVDLTRRANLQIRGLDPDDAPALRAALAPTGLVGPSAELEDRRNVLAPPTAGLDDELIDVRLLVDDVVDALDNLPTDLDLTHKFGVLLDGGGTTSLRSIATDVSLGVIAVGDEVLFEIGLGRPLGAAGGPRLAVAASDVPALVAAAATFCAEPPAGAAGRMATVLDIIGLAVALDHIGRGAPLVPVEVPNRRVPVDAAPLGPGPEGANEPRWVGVRPTDTPASAAALSDLVALAGDHGVADIRLTPWRSLVLARGDRHSGLVDTLATRGWTIEPLAANHTDRAVA